jgi:hypothetical protein
MTAPQRKDTYFPGLDGAQRREADAWLRDYLRLVVRIYRDYLERSATTNPHSALDSHNGTGKVCTPDSGFHSTPQ